MSGGSLHAAGHFFRKVHILPRVYSWAQVHRLLGGIQAREFILGWLPGSRDIRSCASSLLSRGAQNEKEFLRRETNAKTLFRFEAPRDTSVPQLVEFKGWLLEGLQATVRGCPRAP